MICGVLRPFGARAPLRLLPGWATNVLEFFFEAESMIDGFACFWVHLLNLAALRHSFLFLLLRESEICGIKIPRCSLVFKCSSGLVSVKTVTYNSSQGPCISPTTRNTPLPSTLSRVVNKILEDFPHFQVPHNRILPPYQ